MFATQRWNHNALLCGGSKWFHRINNNEAEEWLKEREYYRLAKGELQKPDSKWKFLGYNEVIVKAALDRQPLLGTGPLPDWLRNIARGRVGPIVALDTYNDSLCLWRCIAVHQGSRPDQSTKAARRLAKSFFKQDYIPNDYPKTGLNELFKVEQHLNKGKALSDWLASRFMSQTVKKMGLWCGVWLASLQPIGVYEGHAFLIRDIENLAKLYACDNCPARFTKVCNL